MMKSVLTIAGSDSSGGAGIQADLKAINAFSCHGMTVVTALTAQNTKQVQSVLPVSALFVRNQLEAVFSDIEPNAIKIGMLCNEEIVHEVAKWLRSFKSIPIVLDPVMISTSGYSLLESSAIESVKRELFPLCKVITPNLPEAETLLGRKISTESEMRDAAQAMLQWGSEYVLLKGGHRKIAQCSDLLVSLRSEYWFHEKRIPLLHTHGTGCTLSAAIASGLAKGENINSSVLHAKKYLTANLKRLFLQTIDHTIRA